MREAGASTIAQDESTSVVWGMPGAAWQIGAVQSLHSLQQIAGQILNLATDHSDALKNTAARSINH
jgi:two-component system chemotaxis response regulator CheB